MPNNLNLETGRTEEKNLCNHLGFVSARAGYLLLLPNFASLPVLDELSPAWHLGLCFEVNCLKTDHSATRRQYELYRGINM